MKRNKWKIGVRRNFKNNFAFKSKRISFNRKDIEEEIKMLCTSKVGKSREIGVILDRGIVVWIVQFEELSCNEVTL